MKRIGLALMVFATGTTVFCALHHSNAQFRSAWTANLAALTTQTQLVATARSEWTELMERVRELKESLPTPTRGESEEAELLAVVGTNGLPRLTPAQRERLLAEMGFNWNTTGPYLMVSKQTLREISLEGFTGKLKLTGTARDMLAVTPDERVAIEATMQRSREDYKSWLEAHLIRGEPAGDVVARYEIPAAPDFAKESNARFTSAVKAAVGEERAALLLDYVRDWMSDFGMYGSESSTMTVKRYTAGQEARLNVQIKTAAATTSTDAVPDNDKFPEKFRPLFPGGWLDVAKREGFELPKEFLKKSPPPLPDIREFQ